MTTARTINTYRIHYFYQDNERCKGGVVIIQAASEFQARALLVSREGYADGSLQVFAIAQQRGGEDGE